MENFGNFCGWEKYKALFILKTALDLGMDISGYGVLDVNPNSGNTYLWLEEYNFCLRMPTCCELEISDVVASYTDSYDGEETEINLTRLTTLSELEKWACDLENKSQDKAG